jgi:flagellar protein FliO/FliZ
MHRPRAPLRAALGLALCLVTWTIVEPAPARADSPANSIERPKPAERSALRSFLDGSRSNRPVGLDTSWWGKAGITLALAACGGVYAACRRLLPQNAAGVVQVVGRVSLSPKHTVYVLKVGRRALLVGAGPQGAPALITELDDLPGLEPNPPQQGAEP